MNGNPLHSIPVKKETDIKAYQQLGLFLLYTC